MPRRTRRSQVQLERWRKHKASELPDKPADAPPCSPSVLNKKLGSTLPAGPFCMAGKPSDLYNTTHPDWAPSLKLSAETSSEHLRGGAAGKASSSSVMAGNWEAAGSLDQITVVKIDDTHIAGEQSHGGGKARSNVTEYYEMEYSLPIKEEEEVEEEEDGIYVIEYSNPEEEGESYQFTMSVDRSLPSKKPVIKQPAVPERSADPPPSRPMRLEEARREELVSNKSVLELGEDYSDILNWGQKQLVCSMCPPPGKTFKRASGLAVHLKQMHYKEGKKTFFCTSCQQSVRTQVELDAHTRRHANQDAVFTCHVCPAGGPEAFSGPRWGLKKHLEKEHPGVIPRCHICSKGFKSLTSYLADQFRHVGVSPYYCAKCQIYEMTERGLSVHNKNHNKKKKREQQQQQQQQQDGHELPPGTLSSDNSATDDSDF
ncbi:zinc finger protein 354C [Acanthochromis polyacanthus]|uniref:zinc finger protein 354C n=1 Tax=Acanthochromis polyacanthus TaxID=80966 RepID=UPI0022341C54|nr:zinc finger protein 354C [Acanthochromis polyacanthus]